MKVVNSLRARRDLERVTAWWLKEIRLPPHALLDELESTLRVLERVPEAGTPYASSRGRTVYRILLRESQLHVYYRLEDDVLRILTIRSTARKRGAGFPTQ